MHQGRQLTCLQMMDTMVLLNRAGFPSPSGILGQCTAWAQSRNAICSEISRETRAEW
jgi:hypothetical protein